ncbi:MAG: hypothetical protein WCV85_03425 [Patescibacteria group bacterium]|jgi:hypothetical protein
MKKVNLTQFRQHLHPERISLWFGWVLLAMLIIGLGITGWKNYSTWIRTLTVNEVSADVLSQKQERIRLKELETAQKAWEAKQQLAPTPEKAIQVFSNGS